MNKKVNRTRNLMYAKWHYDPLRQIIKQEGTEHVEKKKSGSRTRRLKRILETVRLHCYLDSS